MTRTLYTDARVFTANLPEQGPEWVEALVVDGDAIAYAGEAASARASAGPSRVGWCCTEGVPRPSAPLRRAQGPPGDPSPTEHATRLQKRPSPPRRPHAS